MTQSGVFHTFIKQIILALSPGLSNNAVGYIEYPQGDCTEAGHEESKITLNFTTPPPDDTDSSIPQTERVCGLQSSSAKVTCSLSARTSAGSGPHTEAYDFTLPRSRSISLALT